MQLARNFQATAPPYLRFKVDEFTSSQNRRIVMKMLNVVKNLSLTLILLLGVKNLSASTTFASLPTPSLSTSGSTLSSIDLVFTAGGSSGGAPAGFSLQWMDAEGFVGFPSNTDGVDGLCKASLSGVPGYNQGGGTRYSLDPYQSVVIRIGDILLDQGASSNCSEVLQCGKTYVFRAFSHNVPKGLKKSDYSVNFQASTQPCAPQDMCTLSQGYWKTHSKYGPASEKNIVAGIWDGTYISMYPVEGVYLGNNFYDERALVNIFNTVGTRGNGLPALAHQLIAIKLNMARGTDTTEIANTILAADQLIGNRIPGIDSISSSITSPLTTILDNFIQENHCN